MIVVQAQAAAGKRLVLRATDAEEAARWFCGLRQNLTVLAATGELMQSALLILERLERLEAAETADAQLAWEQDRG